MNELIESDIILGYTCILFTITDFMYVLEEEGKIDPVFARTIIEWTKEHQVAGVN